MSTAPGKRQTLLLTAGAVALALLLLVALVLPAEYSIDPLGSGKALGLLGLADGGAPALQPAAAAHRTDSHTFRLAAWESVEYGYQLERDAVLVFSWQADGELVYNLHGSPAGGPAGYAEGFANGRSRSQAGTFTAPFRGRHGWFFENRSGADVTVTLVTAGFLGEAIEASVAGERRSTPRNVLQ